MFLSLSEIVDIVAMSLVVGYLFKDVFRQPEARHPDEFLRNVTPGFKAPKLNDFWFAVILVAPSIIVHEFGHKFTAMAFGLAATFQAAYMWLGIAILLKLVLPGFLFFVPAYTSILGNASPLQGVLISFAGPAVNGLFWLATVVWLRFLPAKTRTRHGKETLRFLVLFRRINGFLFVFNMLPIPGFDGFHTYASLWRLFV